MEWLTQNWLLLVVGVVAFYLMRRSGGCCGHGGPAKEHQHGKPGAKVTTPHNSTK